MSSNFCMACEKHREIAAYYTRGNQELGICRVCMTRDKGLVALIHYKLIQSGFEKESYYSNWDEDDYENDAYSSVRKAYTRQETEEQKQKRLEREQKEQKEAEKRKLEEQRKREQQERENAIKKRKKALEPLNRFVGMSHIKKQIEDWLIHLEAVEILKKKTKIQFEHPSMNLFLTGNPGTGKTELARMIAKILHQAGFLKENKCVEVQAQDIIGKYVGHTGPQTQEKIEQAIGGVFFLDEAYRIAESPKGDKGDYGKEALETIMVAMEKHRRNTVFIFAGYEDRMQGLLEMNEGLQSRIAHYFKLNDFTKEELTIIAVNLLEKKGYKIDKVRDIIKESIGNQMEQGVLKGNARTIRTFVDNIIQQHLIRISQSEDIENYEEVTESDVRKASDKPKHDPEGLKEMYKEAQNELQTMIGLDSVKKEMKRIADFQYVQQKRKTMGLSSQSKTHHMLFKGEPGTGKTTVARIVGKIFRGAGVLSNGHFVEVTKDSLITGDNIPKTVKRLIQKAKGGVLFIDEAYALANDGRGKEALDALIAEIENNREDLVVILAGYEEDMAHLLSVNEGLASRIPYHFLFEDYTSEQLASMAKQRFVQEGYQLNEDSSNALEKAIGGAYEDKMIDGNGRWIRNLFEQTIVSQSERIMSLELGESEVTLEEYQIISPEDINEAITHLQMVTRKKGSSRKKQDKIPDTILEALKDFAEKQENEKKKYA